jgi:K+-sensing histidine kinase KdpD
MLANARPQRREAHAAPKRSRTSDGSPGLSSVTVDSVMACMDPAARARAVLTRAARLASELSAIWYAVYVTDPRGSADDLMSRELLTENMTVAESLGAIVVRVIADNPAGGLMAFAEREGVTHVVVGDCNRRLWTGTSTAARLREIRGAALVTVQLD